MSIKRNIIALVAVAALSACSTTEEQAYKENTVEVLYNKGMDQLEENEYTKSAETFDEVERQHPYSNWATKAQVMAAYAHYKGQKYDKVIASLESFTQLHPAHEYVPYALYMTGLSYYEQVEPAQRDQADNIDALRTFNELIRRFPNTDYAKDAKQRITLLNDAMAGKSMEIGRFYLKKKSYYAAVGRFQHVAAKYDTTKHVEEALYRMVESYHGMSLDAEAHNAASVLGHNYPSSPWYAEAYSLLGKGKGKGAGLSAPQSEKITDIKPKEEGWLDRLTNWNKGSIDPQE